MPITQAALSGAGYDVKAAPVDDWREYDEQNPVPNYFDFDWFSSRHPDLYHRFALTSTGLMKELNQLVDLGGLSVLEVGAGTGRVAIEAGKTAHSVTALDVFESVIAFGSAMLRQEGIANVRYIRGHCDHLPFPDSSFDAFISSWAVLSFAEAYRVLRPNGVLIWLGPAPGALCGELTALLADEFPHLITEIAPAEWFDAACPDADTALQESTWNGVPVIPTTLQHDFTFVADYGDYQEAAAILGRLYGRAVKRYLLDRQQATVAWRLRIVIGQVNK